MAILLIGQIITEQKIDLKQTYKVKIENLADTNTEIGKVIRSEELIIYFIMVVTI